MKQLLLIMTLAIFWTDVFSQTARNQNTQPQTSTSPAQMAFTQTQSAQDGQRVNGQVFNPNGIPMVYVEGNGKIDGFYIGKFEVTQRAWKAVMGYNPSMYYVHDNNPVESVSWEDVQEFIQKINELTGQSYRLPTEAEWEYAAKGGNISRGFTYSGSNNINDVAVYSKNNKYRPTIKVKGNSFTNGPHKVGSKQPNELGIHDMTGNVREWCDDCWGRDCKNRVTKMGSYLDAAKSSRVETRTYQKAAGLKPQKGYYYIGFRLAHP